MHNITDEEYQEYINLKQKEDEKINIFKFLNEIQGIAYTRIQRKYNEADSLEDCYYWVCNCCGKYAEEIDNISHHEGCDHGKKIKKIIEKYHIVKCSAYNATLWKK